MDPHTMMKRFLDSSTSYGDERPSFVVSFPASRPPPSSSGLFWKDASSSTTPSPLAILPPTCHPPSLLSSSPTTGLLSLTKRRLPQLPALENHPSLPPKLKHPKLERSDDFESIFSTARSSDYPISYLPINFSESEGSASIPLKPCSSTCPFHRLPHLLEKHSSMAFSNYLAESSAALPPLVDPYKEPPPGSSKSTNPLKERAFQRRKLIRDKFHGLERLLPYGRKLDTASMLEEARKYIMFLEAQVGALKWMQHTATASHSVPEWLNREQLLHMMVNSTAVQARLSEKEWCIVSAEQADALMLAIQRLIVKQQMIN